MLCVSLLIFQTIRECYAGSRPADYDYGMHVTYGSPFIMSGARKLIGKPIACLPQVIAIMCIPLMKEDSFLQGMLAWLRV